MVVAVERFHSYLSAIMPDHKATHERLPMAEMVRETRIDMEDAALQCQGLAHEDALLLRVVVKLLLYLEDQIRSNAYMEIPDSTTAELGHLLAFLLQSTFGVAIPESLCELAYSDIRGLSEADWRGLCKEDTMTLKEFFLAMGALVRRPFCGDGKQS